MARFPLFLYAREKYISLRRNLGKRLANEQKNLNFSLDIIVPNLEKNRDFCVHWLAVVPYKAFILYALMCVLGRSD